MRRRLLPLVGVDASSPAERDELFAAWRRFLERVAEQTPTVLVFEDLHWADDAMLAFLEHLADRSEGVSLLVLGTARPELFERHPDYAHGVGSVSRIDLGPLSDAESLELISGLLDHSEIREMRIPILERAEGNPLYVEEFLRLLKDRDLLVEECGAWVLRPGSELPVPGSIHSLLAARLDTLPPAQKAMLSDAAVVGKVFWAGAVAAMGDRSLEDVTSAMHELSHKELVRISRRSSMQGESEYAFWHVLTRDVAYGQLPRASRASRHVAAARWIESKAPERVEDLADVLAYHYASCPGARPCGRRADASGRPRGAGAAVPHPRRRSCARAGHEARRCRTSSGRSSSRHRGTPTVPRRWSASARRRSRRGATPRRQRRWRRRPLPSALAAIPPPRRGRCIRSRDHCKRSAIRGGGHWLSRPWRSSSPCDPAPTSSRRSPTWRGVNPSVGGRRPGSATPSVRSHLPRSSGCRVPRMHSISGASPAARSATPGGCRTSARRSRSHPRPATGRRWRSTTTTCPCTCGASRARPRPSRSLASGLISRGPGASSAVLDFLLAGILDLLIDTGELDEALTIADDMVPGKKENGELLDLVLLRAAQVRIASLRGQGDRLAPRVDWLEATVGELVQTPDTVISAWAPPLSRARCSVRTRPQPRCSIGSRRLPVRARPSRTAAFLPSLVRAALGIEDSVLAERLVSGLEPRYPYSEHALVAVNAAVTEAHGDLEAAAEGNADAADRWERFGVVPEQAFALLGHGRCLLGLSRPTEAAPVLRHAREIFERLGANPALSETDALLGKATALSS